MKLIIVFEVLNKMMIYKYMAKKGVRQMKKVRIKKKYEDIIKVGIIKREKACKLLRLNDEVVIKQMTNYAKDAWKAYNEYLENREEIYYDDFYNKFNILIKDRVYRTTDYNGDTVKYLDYHLASIVKLNRKLARKIFKNITKQDINFNAMYSLYKKALILEENNISYDYSKIC